MAFSRRKWALLALAVAIVPAVALMRARGSDHADTPAIAAMPGADLTDVYIFPSPTDPTNKVVLVMDVHPLIPSGQASTVTFDPNVLYQFKIDNTGDGVEDLVLQAKFSGSGPTQTFQIAGPVKPTRTGTITQFETPDPNTGTINSTNGTTLTNGALVWCGAREDPFFFDLSRFFFILPDRATPINGVTVPVTQADIPQHAQGFPPSFRGFSQTEPTAGPPTDYLKGFNVLSIVVELPKSLLKGSGNGTIGVWCTTSI